MPVDTGCRQAAPYMAICGLGLGPTFPLYTLAVQNAVELRYVGQATSTGIFFRQIGGTAGAAVMGTVLPAINSWLSQQADLVAAAVLRTPKTAFARSVTRIFFYSIFGPSIHEFRLPALYTHRIWTGIRSSMLI